MNEFTEQAAIERAEWEMQKYAILDTCADITSKIKFEKGEVITVTDNGVTNKFKVLKSEPVYFMDSELITGYKLKCKLLQKCYFNVMWNIRWHNSRV
jgi:hypothetical protein